MINVLKRSEKLQEKLDQNFSATSRKTAQQLKDIKKKVKDLKHQISKVSLNISDNVDISSANLNPQFYVQKNHSDTNRQLAEETRLKSKDRYAPNNIAVAISAGKDGIKETNVTAHGKKNDSYYLFITFFSPLFYIMLK